MERGRRSVGATVCRVPAQVPQGERWESDEEHQTPRATDPESIRKVLAVVGLSAEVSGALPARSPPRQREMEFDG